MPNNGAQPAESFQAQFHRRWRHLSDPHVRALAWLIDAPVLLDAHAPRWRGKVTDLPPQSAERAAAWLAALDRAPAALHACLDLQPFSRLGRYAERLMAFYFEHEGLLVAHGLQVKSKKNRTIGEFDFLLRLDAQLVHWEFATKFYLLHAAPEAGAHGACADCFVGPGLADTLGIKMNKILGRQLALSRNPAAQAHLPQPVADAQALIKGWLFYHPSGFRSEAAFGLADRHCSGFWCELGEFDFAAAERFLILPRLRWLAPAQADMESTLGAAELRPALQQRFASESMPALVALLARDGNQALEFARGFIVPDGWRERAAERLRSAASAAAFT